MPIRKSTCGPAILMATLTAMRAVAGDENTASSSRHDTYTLSTSYSDDNAFAIHAGGSFAVGIASSIRLDAGWNRSPRELADLDTYRGGAAFDHDFGPVGMSIGYEFWGDRDFVDTHSLRGSLYWHGANGLVAVQAERRNIDLSFDVPIGARGFVDDSRSVHSNGYGLSARYSGVRFDVYANGMNYDYDTEVGRLASIIDLSRVPPSQRTTVLQRLGALVFTLGRLNASSLTLANSFLDYSVAAGFDVRFGERMLNIELSRDVSITDGAKLNGASVGFLHPLCAACDIEYRLGVSDEEFAGAAMFGGVTFYWYR